MHFIQAPAVARTQPWRVILGLMILLTGEFAHAQLAENGMPWIADGPNSTSTQCSPTFDATQCATQVVAQYCAAAVTQNPANGQSSLWCNGSISSCEIYSLYVDLCIDTWAGVTWASLEIFAQQAQLYVSNHSHKLADCASCNNVGHPITPANGNVSDRLLDIPRQGGVPQSEFERFYNSVDPGNTDLGVGWRHSFSRQIVPLYTNTTYQPYSGSDPMNSSQFAYPAAACNYGWPQIRASSPQWASASASYTPNLDAGGVCSLSINGTVVATLQVYSATALPAAGSDVLGYTAVRDDGQQVTFSISGSSLVPPTGSTLQLSKTNTGYQLIDDEDNSEMYDESGRLVSITSRAGVTQTLTYNIRRQLSTVTDSFGHALTFGYDSNGRLLSVTDPSSNSVQYGYDSSSRLISVTHLDNTTLSYVYENSSFPNLLTGALDENNSRYASWGYDSLGQGNSTQEAGGAGAVNLVYNSDGVGSVRTTDALGAVRTFSFNLIGERNRVARITGSQCPTCVESAATTYDSAGFVSSRLDYNGNLTCYSNDPVRGLELVRVEGFAPGSACPANLAAYTPAAGTTQRKIATAWSSNFHLPTQIAETTRTTSFGYDTSGNILTKTITDTTVTPNVSRTWTYTYNSFGQVLTVDGPRTDVPDVTTYTYYSCTSGAQCGQIQTVTDAGGHVWTYNTYNTYGHPLTVTDPNGVLNTLTYDAQQRLISRSVAGETFNFSYYPTGLLAAVTLPDGSSLTYIYDAAHRLTQVTDGLGNKIVYTLDAMGNRTAENTYDPSGTLHRTHTRVFNVLSEASQDINAANTAAATTTYGYDSNGNQISAAAPLSRNTSEAYDALNRVNQITDPGNGVTEFTYDTNDNLTAVSDPRSLITSYSYNGFGDLTTQVSPDTANTTKTYDSAGNLSTATDARGATSIYTYDALNRVSSIAYSLGGSTDQRLSFIYDSGTNGVGHLTAASDANHSLAWGYDALGRVISKSQTVGGVTKSVGYSYRSPVRRTTPKCGLGSQMRSGPMRQIRIRPEPGLSPTIYAFRVRSLMARWDCIRTTSETMTRPRAATSRAIR